jgi:HrpA-like RNA helicase
MDSENCLKFVTHLILDQVHERDRYTDMLVGVIKIRLAENPHLRLILLSTNITPPILANYFEQDKIIRIHSPEHAPVVELYLEDIVSTYSKILSVGSSNSIFYFIFIFSWLLQSS